jgi:HK97 family phage portal protein
MNIIQRIWAAFKAAATAMTFTGSAPWAPLFLGRTNFDYRKHVRDGRHNSIVISCLNWVMRTFPEAPLEVLDLDEEEIVGHEMVSLIETPNDFYSGETLWQATVADYNADGNAYWIKIRNGYGEPIQLWWAPSSMMEPRWSNDGSTYITHYEYSPNGVPRRIEPDDVVHFRFGLDPENVRKGLSPLKSLLREIFTDDEAANFSASVLRNLGVPGVIISPASEDVMVLEDDSEAIKAGYKETFSGDNVGEPMVLSGPAAVNVVSWSPEQMSMELLRRVPEERISGAMGVPAIVAGLGAGLDRSTFANMAEARDMAYESNIAPTQRVFASTIKTQLLREWEPNLDEHLVRFDLTRVRVLQEDQNALWERVNTGVQGGWLTVARAKQLVGETPDPADAVYLRSYSMIEVAQGEAGRTVEGEAEEETEPIPEPDEDQDGEKALSTKTAKFRRTVAAGMQQQAIRLSAPFINDLLGAFDEISDLVIEALFGSERSAEQGQHKDDLPPETQWPATVQEAMRDETVIDELIEVLALEELLRDAYERQYALVLSETWDLVADALALAGGVNMPDPVAQDIIRQGGQRIVQISEQTRQAIVEALADGRAAGEGGDDLARRISDYIDGSSLYPGIAEREGPEAAARYRAETIARTETKTAQNISAVKSYEATGIVEAIQVFDGDDCGWTSHDDPDKAHGKIVSFAEALEWPLAHPRCQRTFAPVVRGSR